MKLKSILGIEVARGVAALLVVVYHISRLFEQNFGSFPFGQITEIGHSGVDFFFVLSGFIIFFIHAKDIGVKGKLKPYLIKRAVRVFPMYWFALAGTAALIPFVSSMESPGMLSTVWQILLIPIGSAGLILDVSWSLQYELLFYFVFALLIANRNLGLAVAWVWFITLCYHLFVSGIPVNAPVFLSAFIFQFLIGCCTAHFVVKTNARFGLSALVIGLLYLGAIWCFELQGQIDGFNTSARLHYGLAYSFIVTGIVGVENRYKVVVHPLFLTMGKSSYSLYLCHLLFGGVYYKLLDIAGVCDVVPLSLSAAIVILATVITSVFVSKSIETPCTRYLRKKFL